MYLPEVLVSSLSLLILLLQLFSRGGDVAGYTYCMARTSIIFVCIKSFVVNYYQCVKLVQQDEVISINRGVKCP